MFAFGRRWQWCVWVMMSAAALFVGGMGVAVGMADDSSRDFSSSLVDESLSCDIIQAHSSSWGGVSFGSSRHASGA